RDASFRGAPQGANPEPMNTALEIRRWRCAWVPAFAGTTACVACASMPKPTRAAIVLALPLAALLAQAPGAPTAPAQQGGTMAAISSDLAKELAPKGKLRVAINHGNPVLVQGGPEAPRGVTIDLARELARRTGLALELVPFPAAGKVFE